MLKNLKSKTEQNQNQNQKQTIPNSEIELDLSDDSFDDWYSEEKTADEIADEIPDVDVPVEDEETKSNRSWFNSVFTEEDSPDSMDPEMSDEMYSFSSDATTEITDMIMSNIASKLHGDDIENHQADNANRQKVKRAWELYLRWKKSYVTPSWYLFLTLFITYGMDAITGVYKWYKRYMVMGWSKAWSRVSNSWSSNDELEQEQNSKQHQDAMRNVRKSQVEIDDLPIQNSNVVKSICLYSGEEFDAKNGVPKSSKSNPDLVGKFSSLSNYTSYKHQNGLMNYRGIGNKKK